MIRDLYWRLPDCRSPKPVKNGLHLDLRCDSFETEKARLNGLGAIVVGQHDIFVVLSDPEGNQFCLSRRTDR